MKYTLTTILLNFVCGSLCFAQSSAKPKRNALSLELGKTGLIYHLNYDHKIASKTFGFRIGAGSNFAQHLNVIIAGGGGYYLFGKQNRFFELGIDLQYLVADEISDDQRGFADVFVYPDYSIKTVYQSLNLGYRSYTNKMLFRGGLAPGLMNSKLIPGGYLSLGVRF